MKLGSCERCLANREDGCDMLKQAEADEQASKDFHGGGTVGLEMQRCSL